MSRDILDDSELMSELDGLMMMGTPILSSITERLVRVHKVHPESREGLFLMAGSSWCRSYVNFRHSGLSEQESLGAATASLLQIPAVQQALQMAMAAAATGRFDLGGGL